MRKYRSWVENFLLRLVSYPFLSKILRFFYSQPLSMFFLPFYAKWFDARVNEAEKPLYAYQNLREFFCRRIQMQYRPMDVKENVFVSPVDGKIIAKGPIRSGELIQVKGISYSLEQLLQSSPMSEAFDQGQYLSIYMSPGKYHRVHADIDGMMIDTRTISGRRFPVNRFSRLRIKNLYPQNVRAVTFFKTKFGTHGLVMVGSCQVGSVQMNLDRTDHSKAFCVPVIKGQEIGWFDFGSTVILLWPKGQVVLEKNKKIGDEVFVGETIATATI